MKLYPFILAARLMWTPNTEPDLSHYIVFSGSQSGTYDAYQIAQDTTFSPLENGRFYAVKAVDSAGNVSDLSTEVQYLVNAMAETLYVQDSLKVELVFSRPEVTPDYSLLFVEHRFTNNGFVGNWRPLSQSTGDFSVNSAGRIVINIARLRDYLDPNIPYAFELRISYNDFAPVYALPMMIFSPLQFHLLEIKPYVN